MNFQTFTKFFPWLRGTLWVIYWQVTDNIVTSHSVTYNKCYGMARNYVDRDTLDKRGLLERVLWKISLSYFLDFYITIDFINL
jgi:hypothetical protein